jgi:hypothetical protein
MRKARSRRWFIGLVIGLVFGLGTLIGGTMLGLLGLVATVLVSLQPGRTAAIGGVLTGLGACWLALFASAGARCGAGCEEPDLTPWLLFSSASLVVGLVLTAVAWSGRRR